MNKKLLWIIPAVIIIAVIAFFVWLYTGAFSQAKQNVFKNTGFPIAMVGNNFISGKEFISRVELAKSLLKDDKAYNENDTRTQILNQLVDNQKLEGVAKTHNIKLDSGVVDSEYKVFVQNFAQGDEGKFTTMLQETYKLSPTEFKEKVLSPDLLMTALTVWYNKQADLNADAYNRQTDIKAKLDAGEQFSDVAKALSDDASTKDLGGDTGFVAGADLLPEFETELKGMKLNDVKQIVSRFGLHTVKVLELDPANADRYHLGQIFVKIDNFEKWYADQSAKVKVRKFLKI